MQWKGLKIPLIILSLLVGMALIFGIQTIYQKFIFKGPLDTILNNNRFVESCQISSEGGTLRVNVCIRRDENLMLAYKDVQKVLNQRAGNKPYEIVLTDNRDQTLEQVWYESQYAVYQAVIQGTYQDMADVLERVALEHNAEAIVYLDQDFIFLRFKHDGHTLDEVVPMGVGLATGNSQKLSAGGGVNVKRN